MVGKALLLAAASIMLSCSPGVIIKKKLAEAESNFNDHIGFLVYDPEAGKTLVEFNSGKYFTPASNTKIFTFYASLQMLGDSIPALRYVTTGDSLIFWGTGDPSFLYRESYDNRRVYDFLAHAPFRLFFSSLNFQEKHFGPGWAWDDYMYAYSSERSPFPVYGNLIEVEKSPDNQLQARPSLFARELVVGDSIAKKTEVVRGINSNRITFSPGKINSSDGTWDLPFHTTDDVVVSLLSDTLHKNVELIHYPLPLQYSTLKSIPVDSLYRTMMQESDNFIAEQLLLLCSGTIGDTLATERAICYAKKNFLFDLPDEPVWVDGSGLSRYNLFTPRSLVRLWEKIYLKVPKERLFGLLASGSQNGTLKNWYQADKPYVFGKTGSLSNNHTLSGYLITKKNHVLIFSFMNGNFIAPSREVRRMMQEILLTVRNEY